ncbi:MAG: Com family DNA-binding transcriptional regulator [Pseudomonadota bacterium]
MENIRCTRCGALHFRAAHGALRGVVEIKCRRCGTVTVLRPPEPTPERQERPANGNATCGSTCPPL